MLKDARDMEVSAQDPQDLEDFEAALILMPDLPTEAIPIADRDLKAWSSLLDVLSWEHPPRLRRRTDRSWEK